MLWRAGETGVLVGFELRGGGKERGEERVREVAEMP